MESNQLEALDVLLDKLRTASRMTQIIAALWLILTMLAMPRLHVLGQGSPPGQAVLIERQSQTLEQARERIRANEKELGDLRVELGKQKDTIAELSNQLSIVKGIGIGFGFLVGLFQTLTVVFQRRRNGG